MRCTCCGQPLPTGDPLELAARDLEEACRRAGYLVTPDQRVQEAAAAALLGIATGTLRNWSYGLGPQAVPFVRVGGRRTYRLSDLAKSITRN